MSTRHFEKALDIAKHAQDDAKAIYRDYLRSEDLKKKIRTIRKTAPPNVVEMIDDSLKTTSGHLKAGRYKQYNSETEDLIRHLKSGAELVSKKRPVMKKKGVTKEDAASYLQAVALETLEAQKSKMPTSEIEELLREARDHIESGFYRESMNIGKKALIKIDELKKQHEEYLHQVAAATEAIQSLKTTGMKTETLEKLLAKARKALNNVNYPQMSEHLNRLYERMDDSKRNFKDALDIIDSAGKLISEAEQAGAPLTFAQSVLQEAQTHADKGDYAQARKIGQEAHDEAVKSIQISLEKIKREETDLKQVEDMITEARDALAEASQYVPIPTASEMLDKAIELVKDHDSIDEARQLANDAKAMALETKKQYIETTEKVQEANKILTRLRERGLRPQEQQDMLVQALGAIDENNYLEALRLSKKVLKDLRSREKEMVESEQALERARSMVNDVVGILESSEVDEMLSTIDRATGAMSNGAFGDARSLVMKIIEKLEDMVTTNRDDFIEAKEKLSGVKTAVQLLKREGVITEQLNEILASAEDELRNREFKKSMEALAILDELITALRDAYDRSKTMMTAVQVVLDGMRKRGLDISRFDELFGQAKELFEKGDYDAAFTVAEGIQKDSMPDLASYETIEDANTYITEIRRQMHMIREGLPEVVDVEEKLGISGIFKEYYRRLLYSVVDGALRDVERADGLIGEGKSEDAKQLAEKAMKMSENVGDRYRDALEYMYQAKTIINEMEGSERSKLESIYKKAKAAMEQADYDQTMRLSEDVVKRAEPLTESFQQSVHPLDGQDFSIRPLDDDVLAAAPAPAGIPASDVRAIVDRTWAILREFEKIGIDVSVEKETMQGAENAVQSGAFDDAIRLAEQAKTSVVSKGETLLQEEAVTDPEATNARITLDRCELLMQHMTENDIQHKSVDLLRSRGEDAFAEGRFSAAITFAEEAINKANRVIEDWQQAKFMLEKANEAVADSDKDVSTLLNSAVTEFESRNFRYAMRLTERIFDMLGIPQEVIPFKPTVVPGTVTSAVSGTVAPAVPVPVEVPTPEPTPTVKEASFESDWDSFGTEEGAAEWMSDEVEISPPRTPTALDGPMLTKPAAAPPLVEPEVTEEPPAVALVKTTPVEEGPSTEEEEPAAAVPEPREPSEPSEAEPEPAPISIEEPVSIGEAKAAGEALGVSKEEWLEEHKEVQDTLARLKEMYLKK